MLESGAAAHVRLLHTDVYLLWLEPSNLTKGFIELSSLYEATASQAKQGTRFPLTISPPLTGRYTLLT